MDTHTPTRRSFWAKLFGGLAAAVTAVVGAPVTLAFLDPVRRRTVTGGREPKDYGPLADLEVGVPRKAEVIAERRDAWDRAEPQPIGAIWLVRKDERRVAAFSAVCPHLGCAIGYDAAHRVFACPCHESAYAVADGARLRGPAPRGLDPLPVQIRGGRVVVTYLRFVQNIPGRRED